MAIKARGELLTQTDVVNLTATFYNTAGIPANTDSFPTVSIILPSGLVALTPTSAGVQQIAVGQYLYQFTIPFNQAFTGVCNDIWQGAISGSYQTQTLSFVVASTELPSILNSDGYISLGDDPGFNYSQTAIGEINKLIKMLKARIYNDGKAKSTDSYGNVIYVDCNIFSVEMLTTFLATSLSDFNQVPFFTFFTWDNCAMIDQFAEVIVEGAVLYALSSQALIEKGREFVITDAGVSFTPPNVAEMLSTQWSTQLNHYWEKLKYIKQSLRPSPIALGSMPIMLSGLNPQINKLKSLRARQVL